MKIRTGFVSNSSSSSFVCTGWVVPIKKYTSHQIKMMAILFSNAFFSYRIKDPVNTTLPIFLDDDVDHYNYVWQLQGSVDVKIEDGHDDIPINGSLKNLCDEYPDTEEGWEELDCDMMTLAVSTNIQEHVKEGVEYILDRALDGDSPYIKLLPGGETFAIGLMNGEGDGSPYGLIKTDEPYGNGIRAPKMSKEVEAKFRRIFDIPDDMEVDHFYAGQGNTM